MKWISLSSAAALVFPIALAAQTPMPTLNPLTMTFKGAGDRYAGLLMQAFDSIPAAKYSFKPTPAQMSIGNVAQHLENANYLLCSAFSGMPHKMTAKDSLPDTVKAAWPKDTLSARLKASFAFCNDAIAKVTDAQLTDMLPSPFGPPGRSFPRARYLLIYDMDLVDHYSQIANYMRLNGLIPPSALPRPNP